MQGVLWTRGYEKLTTSLYQEFRYIKVSYIEV